MKQAKAEDCRASRFVINRGGERRLDVFQARRTSMYRLLRRSLFVPCYIS